MYPASIINKYHATHLRQTGIKITALKYYEIPSDCPFIIISDTLLSSGDFSFSGIALATDIRLAGFRQPLIILSFLNRRQLRQFDKYGILNDPAVYVWSLPLKTDSFIKFIDSIQGTTTTIASGYRLIFRHRFQDIFSTFTHGKRFDLVNKITGPLRAACMLALNYPQKKFFVCDKLKEVKQRIAEDVSIQRLFFITGSYTDKQPEITNQQMTDFISLLKKLTEFTCEETNILELTGHIDALNKAYYLIQKKY